MSRDPADWNETDRRDDSVWSIFRDGLPGLFREGLLPLLAFYVVDRQAGLEAGIAAAAAISLVVYVQERRAGREGVLVRFSLAFVAVQSLIGLVSQSDTAYLATPVLASAAWAILFLGSAAVGRPLAGALANAWYAHPRELRRTAEYRQVYGIESVVWGLYLLGRSALRLAVLLSSSTGMYVIAVVATGPPAFLALVLWSIWFARGRLVMPPAGTADRDDRRPTSPGKRPKSAPDEVRELGSRRQPEQEQQTSQRPALPAGRLRAAVSRRAREGRARRGRRAHPPRGRDRRARPGRAGRSERGDVAGVRLERVASSVFIVRSTSSIAARACCRASSTCSRASGSWRSGIGPMIGSVRSITRRWCSRKRVSSRYAPCAARTAARPGRARARGSCSTTR